MSQPTFIIEMWIYIVCLIVCNYLIEKVDEYLFFGFHTCEERELRSVEDFSLEKPSFQEWNFFVFKELLVVIVVKLERYLGVWSVHITQIKSEIMFYSKFLVGKLKMNFSHEENYK